jgi:hypothetical protein
VTRRVGASLAVAVAFLVAGSLQLNAAATAAKPHPLFHLTNPEIDEASGIAAGIASPGVVYVQNDSGDEARFFALDGRTGRTLATYSVPDATNVDWEDLAVAPDAQGVPSIWLADIGDNTAVRSEVRIYRVDEPHVDRTGTGGTTATSAPQVWRLRYPDGPRDAESLAVSPAGAAVIVSKSLSGASQVFAVPARPDADRVQTVRALGSIRFTFTGTPGGPNLFGQLTATGAALSRKGTLLAVRTYTDAYVWRVRNRTLAAAIRTAPVRIALPAQDQGEGIAFDGDRLIIDSEGVDSTVYAVALPAALTRPAPPPSSARRSSASTASSASSASSADSDSAGLSTRWVQAGAGVLVVAVLAGGWVLIRPRRERR